MQLAAINAEQTRQAERLHAWVSERAVQMEEACMRTLKEKQEADRVAKQFVDVAETRVQEQREVEKAELKGLAGRFEEWRAVSESQYKSRALPLEMKEKAETFWRDQALAHTNQRQSATWAAKTTSEHTEEPNGSPSASRGRELSEG